MSEDWRAMLLNAFVMALAGCALIVGALILAAKAIWSLR